MGMVSVCNGALRRGSDDWVIGGSVKVEPANGHDSYDIGRVKIVQELFVPANACQSVRTNIELGMGYDHRLQRLCEFDGFAVKLDIL